MSHNNRVKRTFFLLFGSLLLACADDRPPTPCVAVLPETDVYVGDTEHVAACFNSSALPLTFQAESSDPAIVGAQVAGGLVALTGERVGDAVVTIQATDVNGLSASQHLLAVVPNRRPRIVRTLEVDVPLWTISRVLLTDYIYDPDRETLDYELELRSDDPTVLKAEAVGDTLVLTSFKRGKVVIAITATDQSQETVKLEGEFSVQKALALITQAAHSRSSHVPLVANREGLLRLFLETERIAVDMPGATATLYHRDGKPIRSIPLESDATLVPGKIDEADLGSSLNAFVDGAFLGPNTARLVIDIDETVDERIPRRIEMPLDVRELPDLNWTLVPVIQGSDSSAIGKVAEMVADPESSPLLELTLHALPIRGHRISGRDPMVLPVDAGQSAQMQAMFTYLNQIRALEGGLGKYMAVTPSAIGRYGGQAYLGASTAWAVAQPVTIAHELGHNFNLMHAPCGNVAGTDGAFPHRDGRIGVWGFNFASQTVFGPDRPDLMGYCFNRPWISDYHFDRALRYREDSGSSTRRSNLPRRVLVVSGWIDATGTPALEPALYADGLPTRVSGDSHQVTGRDADGGTLFAYRFDPPVLMDGPSIGSGFAHTIPVTWGGAELTSITLEGPGGVAVLDPDTDEPLSIIMRDGQVRTIMRGVVATPTSPDERVIFSRGIPRR